MVDSETGYTGSAPNLTPDGSPMREGRPSHTALGAAMRRAAHQLLDDPLVFEDPLAIRIIGADSAKRIHREAAGSLSLSISPRLRAFLAARSRLAEDSLDAAAAHGVRQYVILGAGLDTFAYRARGRYPGLRVFEVDHPTTQVWKRDQLREAGIEIPEFLTFVPVDLASEDLRHALTRAGFDAGRPACFAWLGVSMYCTEAEVMATLGFIASSAPGSTLVFDYLGSLARLSLRARWCSRGSERRVAREGEPWLSRFDPPVLAGALRRMGFETVTDYGVSELYGRYFAGRKDGLRTGPVGHVVAAEVGRGDAR